MDQGAFWQNTEKNEVEAFRVKIMTNRCSWPEGVEKNTIIVDIGVFILDVYSKWSLFSGLNILT